MKPTIRRTMLAVAAFALSLDVGLSYRHSGDYRRQARFYARAGEASRFRALNVESGAAHMDGYTPEQKRNAADYARHFAAYASRMTSKYERAACLPWLPLTPDPPLPGPEHPPETAPADPAK